MSWEPPQKRARQPTSISSSIRSSRHSWPTMPCASSTVPGGWPAHTRDAVMWLRHHGHVPVGVIDVGSNTVRLKVAEGGAEIVSVREMLRLGAAVEEHGLIPAAKLAETAEVVRRFSDLARAAGATELEILITSPGRQAEN